jgi:hypothetical protein
MIRPVAADRDIEGLAEVRRRHLDVVGGESSVSATA